MSIEEAILKIISEKKEIHLDVLVDELSKSRGVDAEKLAVRAALRPLKYADQITVDDDGNIKIKERTFAGSANR